MIRVKDLQKNFAGAKGEVRALRGVSFEVGKGQLFTLLGPSGCGKTTTLRCIAGLEQPSAGEILINERAVFNAADNTFVPPERREELSQFIRLRHLKNVKVIGLLTLCTIFFGFGFGFTVPFFNIFFHEAYDATGDQIGFILALAAFAAAFGSLFTPMVIRRFGKVKGLFVTQLGSLPLLVLLGLMPNLQSSVLVFMVWRGAWSFSMPLRNQFSMEIVSGQERGTTNGLMHGAMDLIASPAAAVAGFALSTGNYFFSFGIAAISFIIAASLWLVFFSRLEHREVVASAAVP